MKCAPLIDVTLFFLLRSTTTRFTFRVARSSVSIGEMGLCKPWPISRLVGRWRSPWYVTPDYPRVELGMFSQKAKERQKDCFKADLSFGLQLGEMPSVANGKGA